MIADYFLVFAGTLGLILGTITDFQKREVADWINYGMIFTGISIRLIYSLIFNEFWFLFFGLAALGVTFLFGLLMYYTGQWGGGDCKMIMGLGALFGTTPFFFNLNWDFISWVLPFNLNYNASFIYHFLFNSFFVGSIYGIFWSFFLLFRNRHSCKKKFIEIMKTSTIKLTLIATFSFFVFGYSFLYFTQTNDLLLQVLLWMIFVLPLLFVFVKTVESAGMIKMMKIKDLTEGEWIVEDVIVDGNRITGPKDLGISYKQIQKLKSFQKKGKIQEVKVKIGIPFVPAFLIAFFITAFYGNILLLFF